MSRMRARALRKQAPTMYDVAALAKVSVATVSHVLNPESEKFVSEELIERVKKAAHELDYRPNFIARSMRGKGRRAIAILVPQFENYLFTRIVMAAEQVAFSNGYVLLICNTYDNTEREKVYIESLISQQVDGFLIVPTIKGTDNTGPLRQRRIPYVIMDRFLDKFPIETYDYVGFDNQLGAELATQYLIDHGHRRIGFIGGMNLIPTLYIRYDGFLATIQRNGLDATTCPAKLGDNSRQAGESLTVELLQQAEVSAIFASQQYMAEGVVAAFQQLHLQCPKDISLIVFGKPTWTELFDPPLVCIDIPDAIIGEQAAELLIDRIEGQSAQPQQFIFAPTLCEGGSVGEDPATAGSSQ